MDLEDLRAVSYTATQPQVLLSYRAGLFPMGVGHGAPVGWDGGLHDDVEFCFPVTCA